MKDEVVTLRRGEGDMKIWSKVSILILLGFFIIVSLYFLINLKDENNPPTAEILYTPSMAFYKEECYFKGMGNDSDGQIILYEWDFNGDGIFDYSSNKSSIVIYEFEEVGEFIVTFRVTDDDGATATDSYEIIVTFKMPPEGPDAWITNPSYNEEVSGIINITGQAYSMDKRFNFTSVEIKLDNNNWTETNFRFNNSPHDIDWYFIFDTNKLSNGEHTIYIRAGYDFENDPGWIDNDKEIRIQN